MFPSHDQGATPDIEDYSHILITRATPECKLIKGKKAIHTAPLYILNEGESSND